MSDELKHEASGNGGEATTRAPYAPLDCWAVAILLRKTEYDNSKAIETMRLVAAWCADCSKNEAIGRCTDEMLAKHPGFSLANIVATRIDMPNPSLQGTGHLVDRTLQGVVGGQNSEEK